VRGDSLRDFYAKTLAILGLGLLAGIGALVDYWPVGGSTPPVVAGPAFLPELPALTPAAGLAVVLPPAPVRATRLASRTLAPRPAATVPVSFVAVAMSGVGPVGEPLTLEAPRPLIVAPEPAVDPPAALIELPAAPPPYETVPAFGPSRLSAGTSDSGFFMDALKKTGAGIVKTGAVTGASIADAFRGVLGAFKKVSPFKDRGFGTN